MEEDNNSLKIKVWNGVLDGLMWSMPMANQGSVKNFV
jgi:hypothetical protein